MGIIKERVGTGTIMKAEKEEVEGRKAEKAREE